MNKYSFILLSFGLVIACIATRTVIRSPNNQVAPGIRHLLDHYSQYRIQIGVGDQVYSISKVELVGDSLTIYYPDYNNGYETGFIDHKGNFTGIFKTDVSDGTVKMTFNSDGTATGAWLLDKEWMDFYQTNKSVYGMGYGPNNIQRVKE